MSPRLLSAGLWLAAAAVWMGFGAPARVERDRARSDYARAREQREHLRGQLARLERPGTPVGADAGPAAARALRAALLQGTDGLDLRDVRLDAAPAPRSGARGHLAVSGRVTDLLQLAERLARPGSGVRMLRVQLTQAPHDLERLGLEIDAVAVGSRP